MSSASEVKKKVLILYSLQPRMPAYKVLDQNFLNLQLNKDTQVEYFTEYLELSRFRDEDSIQSQADLINHRYKKNKPDIVIAVMSPALDFIQKYCKATFDNIPIVYALIDKKADPDNMGIKATGVNLHIDLLKTLNAALLIQPETRDVYVVVGTSPLGKSWEAQAKENFQELSETINFHYLSDLSMAGILDKVSKLPAEAIVLYLLIFKDASGKQFVPRDALNTISKSSSVPVYGLWSTYVGHGIIGGHLCSSDMLGKNVNKMIVRILNGESPDAIEPISLGPSIYMFDWRQMKRFGISEKQIPDENIILFKPQTVWDKYKIYIVVFFLFALVEAILILVLALSIKKQKRSEQEIREKTREMIETQKLSHIGSWEYDPLADKITWCDQSYKNYGVDPGTQLGIKDLYTLIHPDYRQYHKEQTERLRKHGELSFNYPIELPTGETRWIFATGKVEYNNGNEPIRLLGLTQNITEQKKTEDELKRSEFKYRSMMESMTDPVYICSSDLTVEYMNPAMIERSGRDMTGQKCYSALHEINEPCEWCIFNKVTSGETAENTIVSPKDNRHYRLTNMPITHSDGSVSKMSIMRDITDYVQAVEEKKKADEQFFEAQKMESIGNLAGGIAHDFNNILSSIIGFSQIALTDAEKGSNLEDDLNEINQAGFRAKELVKQILTFARKSEDESMPVEPSIILEEMLKFLRSSIPTSIEIRKTIESTSSIMGNSTQMHQVLMNLCTNAVQSMEDDGGVLEINLKDVHIKNLDSEIGLAPGEYVEIVVSDTGAGIPEEIVQSIFEPYYTTKSAGEGTGLGLAVVHGIVEKYNGKIIVKSKKNKGTTFRLFFPVTQKKQPKKSKESNLIPAGSEHILFVDDEIAITKMGKRTLEKLGYQVTTENSSVRSLELYKDNHENIDLIITDMTMPEMTGDKLAAEMLSIDAGKPIIICTGYSKKITLSSAKKIGIRSLVYKPLNIKDLAKTIRAVLDNKSTT